jgi:hypothetical protein
VRPSSQSSLDYPSLIAFSGVWCRLEEGIWDAFDIRHRTRSVRSHVRQDASSIDQMAPNNAPSEIYKRSIDCSSIVTFEKHLSHSRIFSSAIIMIFTRIFLLILASVEPDVAYNTAGIELVTARLQGGRKWRRRYTSAVVLVGSGLLVAERIGCWKGGKGGQPSLMTAVPAKQEDGPNSLAIYHAHRMSLMAFKDHCDAHFPIPSATDLFSIRFLLLDAPPDPDVPATSTCNAFGDKTYPSCAEFFKVYVPEYCYTPPLLKSS